MGSTQIAIPQGAMLQIARNQVDEGVGADDELRGCAPCGPADARDRMAAERIPCLTGAGCCRTGARAQRHQRHPVAAGCRCFSVASAVVSQRSWSRASP